MRRAPLRLSETPELDPVLDFMRLLWRIEHSLQRRSKEMGATLDITGPQRLVLKIVSRFSGLSAGELARIVQLHPSTITGILQRLIDKGLLERESDPADRRRVRLRIRAAARPFTRRSAGTIELAVAGALARVPRAQIARSRALLSAIADALEPPQTPPGKRARIPASRR